MRFTRNTSIRFVRISRVFEAASVACDADSLSKAAQARIELRKASDQAGQRSASIAEEQ